MILAIVLFRKIRLFILCGVQLITPRGIDFTHTVEPGYNDTAFTTPRLQRQTCRGTNSFLNV